MHSKPPPLTTRKQRLVVISLKTTCSSSLFFFLLFQPCQIQQKLDPTNSWIVYPKAFSFAPCVASTFLTICSPLMFAQPVPLSERDVSRHQITSNDVAPSLRRAMTRTGTRQLTKDDRFRNQASVHIGNVTKPTHTVLTKKIRHVQRHAKLLRKCRR